LCPGTYLLETVCEDSATPSIPGRMTDYSEVILLAW
jgi:hypothetical protein